MDKIEKKIVGYKVKTEEGKVLPAASASTAEENSFLNPISKREMVLTSKTYKIKPACIRESMYITISDREFKGALRPYEIFINSKNVEHFEHITCITRLLSAIFRTCDDIEFAIKELLSVHNPNGGYWGKPSAIAAKPEYYRSILNEIGAVIHYHVKEQKVHVVEQEDGVSFTIGSAGNPDAVPVSEFMQEAIAASGEAPEAFNKGSFLPAACAECGEHQLVLRDGCPTCLSCGFSKCG